MTPAEHRIVKAEVERLLAENAVAPYQELMRRTFANLQPLEAIALLGYLVAETVERFPPDQRAEILAAFCDELQATPDA
jgi:hypothetical protein